MRLQSPTSGERLSASLWGLWRLPLTHHLPYSIAGATQPKDSKQCSHNSRQWTPGLCLQLASHLHLGGEQGVPEGSVETSRQEGAKKTKLGEGDMDSIAAPGRFHPNHSRFTAFLGPG